MSSSRPTSIQCWPVNSADLGQDAVLMRLGAARPLGPGIALHRALRREEALVQDAPVLVVADDPLAHGVDADPRHPRRRAFEVARLLAIKLHKGADMLQH